MSLTRYNKIVFSGLLMALSLLVSAQMVLAETGADKASKGLVDTATKGYGTLPTQTDLPIIIGRVVGGLLALVGVVFFLLILWAGFSWMTAKGNEEEINKAKEVIFGAVLGLIVILGAYAITNLVAFIFSEALSTPPPP